MFFVCVCLFIAAAYCIFAGAFYASSAWTSSSVNTGKQARLSSYAHPVVLLCVCLSVSVSVSVYVLCSLVMWCTLLLVMKFPIGTQNSATNPRAALSAVSMGLGGLVGVGPSSKQITSSLMLNQDHSFPGDHLLAALGNPTLESQVRLILARNDLTEQRKVELIANLIKPTSTLSPAPP